VYRQHTWDVKYEAVRDLYAELVSK
jgi:hypothetical protein